MTPEEELELEFKNYLKAIIGIDPDEVKRTLRKITTSPERPCRLLEFGAGGLWGEDVAVLICAFRKMGLKRGKDYDYSCEDGHHWFFTYNHNEKVRKALKLADEYHDAMEIRYYAELIMPAVENVKEALKLAPKIVQMRRELARTHQCPLCGKQCIPIIRFTFNSKGCIITGDLSCGHQIHKIIAFRREAEVEVP